MRLVQISDTHLSHLGGPANDNLERLIPFVNDELRPDLVVHSGDVLMANPETVPEQVGGRPVLVFGHKPFWPPAPAPTENPSDTEQFVSTAREVGVTVHA